jgi:hypothetical protein
MPKAKGAQGRIKLHESAPIPVINYSNYFPLIMNEEEKGILHQG